jgi:hypothetical protein
MTIVFMSLFATTIGERISMDVGRRSLLPLLLIGVFSVIYWRLTGDLRLYGVVQFYPMIAISVLLLLRPPRYPQSGGLSGMITFYAVAKVFELFDRQVAVILPSGGHPWKHAAAAAALLCYVTTVAHRRPGDGPGA